MNAPLDKIDVTDVLLQQSGATGLAARIELLRALDMLRSHSARVALYCAMSLFMQDEKDKAFCVAGIQRALPGAQAALDLVAGDRPVHGIDANALDWLRGTARDMPESVATMRDFVQAITDLARAREAGKLTTDDMVRLCRFAATGFNQHYAKLSNRLSQELHAERSQRKQAAQANGDAARAALQEISEISKNVGLIAINASIEAAHVGEQGRGFAIIATEIRELSEKIETANTRVQALMDGLIRTVQQD